MTDLTATKRPPESTNTDETYVRWVSELVHQHRRSLIGAARRQGLSAEDALDCVQDAFFSFMQLPQARAIAELRADSAKLLQVVLRHVMANRRRSLSRRARLLVSLAEEPPGLEAASSETLIAEAESAAHMEGCIQRLAELQRRVIELSLLDENSSEDIAQICGISAGHARVLLHRSRRYLRQCMTEAHASPVELNTAARSRAAL
jgi:RNA polymerase sigma factor (sigma-70 family)